MERILITGSRGLIGRILMDRLASHYELYGLDLKTGEVNDHQFQVDISEFEQVEDFFNHLPAFHYVIHLAANPKVKADWQSVLSNNIHGTWNVYEAARLKGGVRRIVFASSNHVTGYYEGVPPTLCEELNPPMISIDQPPRPDGPYGISKLTGEAIARFYFDQYGIESVCLRIGSVTVAPGDPKERRHLCVWLSYDDLERLVRCSLTADETFPGFGIYYGVSRNTKRFWDISNALEELGYDPQDDASDHWGE
ncbi:MAG: NAD-dependent epimerase/dehydratase family protein [Anaerolineales bacterium]|nr:NAD-dependent epimerase/dehydratase family protein [Anaerolineales bacterium]